MPRRPADDPRTEREGCRFTPMEVQGIERGVRLYRLNSKSAFIRLATVEALKRLPAAPVEPARKPRYIAGPAGPQLAEPATPPPASDRRELVEQIRRVGVNINQISRHLNEGRTALPELERELRAALAEVRFVVRQARQP